jgi:Zn-finger nucleic acid-binding protein
MKCPNCNVNLVMTERSGIEIDYCPDCRGVWLDRGELDKIIERSSAQNTQPTQPNVYVDKKYYTKDSDYRYKKKKNLFDDLFDF